MNRRFLAIVVAAALAMLGIVLVLAYVHDQGDRISAGQHPVNVLAAEKPIPAGTSVTTALRSGMLHTVPYPRAALPPDFIRSGTLSRQESIEVFTSALHSAQIVVSSDLGPKSDASSTLVPPPGNYVEMGLPVCESAAVSGYIGPGSTVAVYDTAGKNQPMQSSCSSHEPPGGGTETWVVATGLEVLSVQGAPSPGTSAGTPVSNGGDEATCSGEGEICVTVAVPTSESLKLADAAATGDLTVVMMTSETTPPPPGTTYNSKH